MEFKSFLEYDISSAIKNIAKTFRYGIYCGPNKTGEIVSKPCNVHDSGDPLKSPKDKLDSLCMNHDVDYCKCGDEWTAGLLGNKGSACSREADNKFIGDIRQNIDSMNPKQKFIANLILTYFRMHGSLQKII